MATDVNKESRKRKSASNLMFEVEETDLSPSNTPEPTEENASCPISETEASQMSTDVSKTSEDIILKPDDILLKQEINSNSDESNIKLKCAIASNELNMKTKTSKLNNSLKPDKTSTAYIAVSTQTMVKEETVSVPGIPKTDVDLRCMDMEVDNSPPPAPSIEKPFISVIFRDKDTAYRIRSKMIHYIQNVIDFELKLKLTTYPSDLTIDFWEDNEETTINYDMPPNIKSAPCKPEPEKLDLFVVDTTPSKKPELLPRYTQANLCKPIGEPEPATNGNVDNSLICRPLQTCFNCDGDHAMKDCKEMRNARRIAMARNKFRSQQKNVRYHVDDEVKYKHLVPGKISDELRRALDVRKHELPPYIYRMRTLGYPPGWLQEAMISNSKLELFDFQGCAVDDGGGDSKKIDSTKVVEYPGFNAPLEKGYKDEFKYYNCPPYNEKYNKNCMVEYIEQIGGPVIVKKEIVTINSTPRELESDSNSQESACTEKLRRSESPTLTDLELRKKQLLAELEDGSLNSPQPTNETNDKQINPLSKDLIESPVVVSSSFGTPLLKSASPFIQLPERDKFSKDISQVINFENLPDSTGKYEQMSVVINKVRETVKTTKSS